jgi:hypothetical protein
MNTKHLFLACASLALLATSCSSELETGAPDGADATVSFNVNLEKIASRAYSDGTTATKLNYTVYEQGTQNVIINDSAEININAQVNLNLVTGRKYDIIFWAAAEDAPYYYDSKTQTITADYTNVAANSENLDAFYAHTTINVTGPLSESVTLARPFAQINIGTADYDYAIKAKMIESRETVKVAVKTQSHEQLNLMTDQITIPTGSSDLVDVEFAKAAIPTGDAKEEFPVNGYEYLAMNYILVPNDKELTTVAIAVYDGEKTDAEFEASYSNIPVRRNYRTNIYGNLFTSPTTFNVTINKDYDGEENVWDGTSYTEPVYNTETKEVSISTPSEFVYLLANEGVATTEGGSTKAKVYELTADIDMGGYEVPQPNASTVYTYYGYTINGNGHTISNFKTQVYDGRSGLFNQAVAFTVNDLNIENAVIGNTDIKWNDAANEPYNQYAGVVVGQGYHLTYNNITVKNCTVYGNNKVGGIMGFAAENEINITNCKVINCKLYGLTTDGGSVGGILGSNSGKATIENCSVENTLISAPLGAASYKRGNGLIIGTVLAETVVNNCSYDQASLEKLNSNYTINYWIGAKREPTSTFSVTIDGVNATWAKESLTPAANSTLPE